jgi:hypothetical protein
VPTKLRDNGIRRTAMLTAGHPDIAQIVVEHA